MVKKQVIYPNATVTEVREKSKWFNASFGKVKKYVKGNFAYFIEKGEVNAMYLPSMKKKLKIMFVWKYKDEKMAFTELERRN